MKISIDQIEATLLERKIEPVKVQEIIRELTKAAQEEAEERRENASPKQKWEHIIIVSDPDQKLDENFTGWVVQQKEGEDAGEIISKLTDAARNQNEMAKRKKMVIKTFGEIFEFLKSKWIKDEGLRIKTKIPVRVLTINNNSL
ncbi:MAG TPA: hypothetical protein PKX15_03325 [Bacteroidales bacterium]|nr:hypothetical protein [Bacteroidales bacterium]